jgi:hypothetical protein
MWFIQKKLNDTKYFSVGGSHWHRQCPSEPMAQIGHNMENSGVSFGFFHARFFILAEGSSWISVMRSCSSFANNHVSAKIIESWGPTPSYCAASGSLELHLIKGTELIHWEFGSIWSIWHTKFAKYLLNYSQIKIFSYAQKHSDYRFVTFHVH